VLDEEEYQRWMDSAKQTLDSAKVDLNSGFYNWACFKSQQSAELAVKAYLYGIGQPKAGHSIAYLLSLIEAPQEIIEKGKYLTSSTFPRGIQMPGLQVPPVFIIPGRRQKTQLNMPRIL
jgi:Uncharacterized conserved protein related to C-terminal domain of eukaryotic chaperone, SACSIN